MRVTAESSLYERFVLFFLFQQQLTAKYSRWILLLLATATITFMILSTQTYKRPFIRALIHGDISNHYMFQYLSFYYILPPIRYFVV